MPATDTEAVKRAAHAEWESDPALRAEFTSRDAYVAYRLADARGAARIMNRKTVAEAVFERVVAAAVPAVDSQDLARRQALVRQENVGRAFAGLPALSIPQH